MIDSRVRWWQRLLSYFTEVSLQTIEGEYNPSLQVSLVRNRFQLSTENAIYSFDDLYLNFSRAFQQVTLPSDDSSLLLLGLGLGSVPLMLEQQFSRYYDITAVEFDESVISLASAFTFPRLKQKMHVVHADGEIYVQSVENTFDFIILDLFLDDVIPPYFESREGIEQIKSILSPDGMLMINRLYRSGSDKKRTDRFYKDVFLKVFETGRHLDVHGNWILLNR
ncbi:MAG: fused MFS/spermidine synthase [Saprospiraceae bacterium]|nr:fused MFS/spermidine synthase [Saprospiraceae bacterium]